MILRPRLIVQATCATWVCVMGGLLYASAIWSIYESHEKPQTREGVHVSLPVPPAHASSRLLTCDASARAEQSDARTGRPHKGESCGQAAAGLTAGKTASASFESEVGPSLAAVNLPRSRGVRYEPGSGSPSSLGLTESRAGALRQMATDAAKRCRVPARLFHSLIHRESSFNPKAVSKSGARGLTQLLPRYHSHSLLDIDDPLTNLSIGCAYLRRLIDLRRGNVRLALLDFNGGPNRKATTQAHRDYADDIMGSAQ